VSGGAAGTAADQRPPGRADGSYHRVNRDRRRHPASVVDLADDGIGLDLDDGAEDADAKERPADSGLVKYEVPREHARVRIHIEG
jgi:hypothetical protein